MTSLRAATVWLSVPLIVAGAGLVVLGLFADLLGFGGAGGFGLRQFLLASAGAVSVGLGIRVHPGRRARARAMLEDLWARSPILTPWQCVWVAGWLGLLVGMVEVLHMLARKALYGALLRQPWHYGWMAPVAYMLLFGAVGALFAALTARWRRLAALPLLVSVLATVGIWGQLRLQRDLDAGAMLLLAVGIAVQMARTWGTRDTLIRFARRSMPVLLAIVLAAFVFVPVRAAVVERAARAALPQPPEQAPNVLLIVLDTVRADHVSVHGYHRDTTPTVASLAAEGVVFDNAFASSPWTLPSHATMFTGRYHHEVSADWLSPLDDTHPTVAEAFAAAGYDTAGFAGNLLYCRAENGLARGFARYEDIQLNWGTFFASSSVCRLFFDEVTQRESGGNDARVVRDLFVDWLRGRGERPWFAFVNFIDAHGLYLCPQPYQEKFGPWRDHVLDWYHRHRWSPAEMQAFRDAYDGCIAYVDAQIASMLAAVEEQSGLDGTLVVVTSDHGELFGEHGLTDHGNSLYRQLLHVPLVLRFPPRVPRGSRVVPPVTHRDLAATMLQLAGVRPPAPFPGTSLARFWAADGDGAADASPVLSAVSEGINRPAHEPISRGDMHSIVGPGMLHLIRNGDGTLELYDLERDFDEEHDLRGTPAGARHVERLLPRLPQQAR